MMLTEVKTEKNELKATCYALAPVTHNICLKIKIGKKKDIQSDVQLRCWRQCVNLQHIEADKCSIH